MRITILGASGFLGKNLAQAVLATTDWQVRAAARDSEKLNVIGAESDRLELIKADALDYDSVVPILKDADVAYYFIHLMGHKERDFYKAELEAAHIFARAANTAGIKRIIYVGGLGDNADSPSRHLRGRYETGRILRSEFREVVELRASMIIGNGSVGYDIIRNVVNKLPIMPLPAITNTLTQPIGIDDAIRYLLAAAEVPLQESVIVDIGGPTVLSYADIYRAYAKYAGKKPFIFRVPYLPARTGSMFLDLLTPEIHARIGTIMLESMGSEMVIVNDNAKRLFPNIRPVPIEEAFERA